MPSASEYTNYLKYAATYSVNSNIVTPNQTRAQTTPYAGAFSAMVRTSEMSRLVGSRITTLTGTGARVMARPLPTYSNPNALSKLSWN